MTEEPPIERAPTSEEDLRAHTVGELKVHGTTVHLAEYDVEWPQLYEREAARIRSVLGDRVRRLDHVGSTSVPGLPAKPVIDIVLAVPDSSDESTYVPDMEAAGYVVRIREPEWYQHRMLEGPDTNIHLHTFTHDAVGLHEIDRMVLFRDWLRTHDDERDLYLRTKRELAAREWRYVQHYADAKTAVVEAIIARAKAKATYHASEVTDAE